MKNGRVMGKDFSNGPTPLPFTLTESIKRRLWRVAHTACESDLCSGNCEILNEININKNNFVKNV